MAHEKHSVFHPYAPFDDSVPGRLRRMGLLTEEGKPDREAMVVVSRLYAGAFYDGLYDFYSDMRNVISVCRELIDLADAEDAQLPFLSICSAYDTIYHSLPAPTWWIAGNLEVAAQFAAGFLGRLSEFTEGSGVML